MASKGAPPIRLVNSSTYNISRMTQLFGLFFCMLVWYLDKNFYSRFCHLCVLGILWEWPRSLIMFQQVTGLLPFWNRSIYLRTVSLDLFFNLLQMLGSLKSKMWYSLIFLKIYFRPAQPRKPLKLPKTEIFGVLTKM